MMQATKIAVGVIAVFFVGAGAMSMMGGAHPASSDPSPDPSTVNPGASAPETRSYPSMSREDKEAVALAHELVEQRLRDPDSAIFDDQRSWMQEPVVLVRRVGGKPVFVCGTVNAKNGYGGMTGDELYVVDLRDNAAMIEVGNTLVKSACPT